MYCAACGTPLAPGLSYCNRCGISLKERSSNAKPVPVGSYLTAITIIGILGLSLMLGGAMFFLLADVGIRERTGNRAGLQHALRAMLDARGKPIGLRELFAIGDRATGTNVLADLYDKMSSTPVTPDLEDLWRRLGVQRIDDGVRFDEAAPLAQVCKAITASARR